jgi:hypothetical protein
MSLLPKRSSKVEVYHRLLWYDATILKARPAIPTPNNKSPQYEAFVHFENWSKRHDNWVPCYRIRPCMMGVEAGSVWMRETVKPEQIKAGYEIEVRIDTHWIPAKIVAGGKGDVYKAQLSTDRSIIDVTIDEIIKRWRTVEAEEKMSSPKKGKGPAAKAAQAAVQQPPEVPAPVAEETFIPLVESVTGGRGRKRKAVNYNEAALSQTLSQQPSPTSTGSASDSPVKVGAVVGAPGAAPPPPERSLETASQTNRRFCVCRTRPDSTRSWIGCRLCLDWFHLECVGMDPHEVGEMVHWLCPECQGRGSEGLGQTRPHKKRSLWRNFEGSGGTDGVTIQRGFEKVRPQAAVANTEDNVCICNKLAAGDGNFVQCEACQQWFHWECIGMDEEAIEEVDAYICHRCTARDAVVSCVQDHVRAAPDYRGIGADNDHDYYVSSVAMVTTPAELAVADFCLLCGGSGTVEEFIFCVECGESFHHKCLNPMLATRCAKVPCLPCEYEKCPTSHDTWAPCNLSQPCAKLRAVGCHT